MASASRNLEFLDMLAVLSFAMQAANYQELHAQATTDDIFSELQRQDNEYLTRILRNQEKILDKLAALTAD